MAQELSDVKERMRVLQEQTTAAMRDKSGLQAQV